MHDLELELNIKCASLLGSTNNLKSRVIDDYG